MAAQTAPMADTDTNTSSRLGVPTVAPPTSKDTPSQDTPSQDPTAQDKPKPIRTRPQKPNYFLIHSKPLPLETHPLPAFVPQNPLSLLRIAYIYLSQLISAPSSHRDIPITGIFSSETRSVHITDHASVRALWEMGFFGKGTMSRSEPSWLDREKARLKANKYGGGTAEENTRKRREERKLFKLERARAEAEQIEETLRKERASALESVDGEKDEEKATEIAISHVFPWMQQQDSDVEFKEETTAVPAETTKPEEPTTNIVEVPILPTGSTIHTTGIPNTTISRAEAEEEETSITNQEHLQLNLEESFFLSYALGSLSILDPTTNLPFSTPSLLSLFRRHSHFPIASTSSLRPDDPFLLNYIVYHHYRSLGWVVRPGVKFSCDFLLYNRGPVFSHAEFALLIVPEYEEGSVEAAEGKGKMGWWWLHCVNRVQSQVKKSLVIVYVKVPKELPSTEDGEVDIGRILRSYEIREFVIRRWLANRSRD
jgi:tRNA-splicing endonuclease subunit Sen2